MRNGRSIQKRVAFHDGARDRSNPQYGQNWIDGSDGTRRQHDAQEIPTAASTFSAFMVLGSIHIEIHKPVSPGGPSQINWI